MPLLGDLRQLDAMRDRTALLRDAVPRVAASGAAALAPVVAAQLAARESPYGEAWPTPKRPPKTAPKGENVDLTANGNEIRATIDHEQRRTHLVIPTEGRGLPDTWRTTLEAVTAAELHGIADGQGDGFA